MNSTKSSRMPSAMLWVLAIVRQDSPRDTEARREKMQNDECRMKNGQRRRDASLFIPHSSFDLCILRILFSVPPCLRGESGFLFQAREHDRTVLTSKGDAVAQ